MSKLLLNGQTEIIGKVVKVIEGGFGEGQKVLFDTQIAEIHGMKNFHVRESINKLINRGRLVKNVDFIDLKEGIEQIDTFDLTEIYAKQASTQAKNIFVLSERGYTKLIKSMDDDTSWDVMEQIVDNYFTMRQVLNSIEQEKKDLIYKIYEGGQEAIGASKRLTEIEVEEATKPLQIEIQGMKPIVDIVDTFINTDGSVNIETFSKILGIPKMGRNNMFKWLREKKILQGNNKPYQSYMKYFKIVPKVNRYTGNTDFITLVNYNGIVYLYKKLKEDGKICNRPIEEIIEDVKNLSVDK